MKYKICFCCCISYSVGVVKKSIPVVGPTPGVERLRPEADHSSACLWRGISLNLGINFYGVIN